MRRFLLSLFLIACTGACCQKGPLVLPNPPRDSRTAVPPSAPDPAAGTRMANRH